MATWKENAHVSRLEDCIYRPADRLANASAEYVRPPMRGRANTRVLVD